MEAQKRAALTEKSALQKEMKDKDAEIEELCANVKELRSLLEAETLCKVDYQNNLQSLNEVGEQCCELAKDLQFLFCWAIQLPGWLFQLGGLECF